MYFEIVNQIMDLIKKSEFKVGEKIPSEIIMAEKFGVSRPTVREALSALEVLDIIESRAGDGTYIKDININSNLKSRVKELLSSEESPHEIIEVRRSIESEVCSLAARKSNTESIEKIRRALNFMIEENKKFGRWSVKADKNFHESIARSINNSILIRIALDIISFMNQSIWRNLREKILDDPIKSKKYLNQHKLIFKAIVSKNPEQARKEMYKHLEDLEKDILYL